MAIKTIPVYATLKEWDYALSQLNDYFEFTKKDYPDKIKEIGVAKGRFDQLKLMLDKLIDKFPELWEDVKSSKKRDNSSGYYLSKIKN